MLIVLIKDNALVNNLNFYFIKFSNLSYIK